MTVGPSDGNRQCWRHYVVCSSRADTQQIHLIFVMSEKDIVSFFKVGDPVSAKFHGVFCLGSVQSVRYRLSCKVYTIYNNNNLCLICCTLI